MRLTGKGGSLLIGGRAFAVGGWGMGGRGMTEAEWLAALSAAEMLLHVTRRPQQAARSNRPNPLRPSDRRLRLFAIAVCRELAEVWRLEKHGEKSYVAALTAFGLCEGMADGSVKSVERVDGYWFYVMNADALSSATNAASECQQGRFRAAGFPERAADVLRDVVGNPWRPSALPPAHVTPDVARLAAVAYARRNDDGTLDSLTLAALADALEEGGLAGVPCRDCDGRGFVRHQDDHGEFHTGCEACGGDGRMTWRDGGGWGPPVIEDGRKGTGRLPNALLSSLRSPGPKYRGLWSLDCLLQKE